MIVNIEKQEIAALTFHMNVMRASFRNIVKKNYPGNLKDYMASYDYVKKEAATALTQDAETHTLHLNIVDLAVLKAFLDAYIKKAQRVNDDAKSDDFQRHLDALKRVKDKADEIAA